MRKWEVFDDSEPRLVLYSSLISHFCHFQKRSENQCKKGCHKLSFLIQKPALGAHWPIDFAFFEDLGELEKSKFFGNRSRHQKNRENCAKGRQKEPRTPARTYFCPAGLPRRPRARDQRESRNEGKEEGSNTPVGQRPGELKLCNFRRF